MDIIDVLLDSIKPDYVYENEYMKVLKVLNEIPVTTSITKRVQLVIWKNKKTDIPDIDIRTFSKRDNKYYKGITLSISEAQKYWIR